MASVAFFWLRWMTHLQSPCGGQSLAIIGNAFQTDQETGSHTRLQWNTGLTPCSNIPTKWRGPKLPLRRSKHWCKDKPSYQTLPVLITTELWTQPIAALIVCASDWKPFFFSLWRSRKCTGLGPYNCISGENLSEKGQNGPCIANPFTTNKTENNSTSDPQISQPDLRFAANPTAKDTRNGAGPNKNTHTNGLPYRYCYLSTVSEVKNIQTNSPAAGQPWRAQLRLTRSSEQNSSQMSQLCINMATIGSIKVAETIICSPLFVL